LLRNLQLFGLSLAAYNRLQRGVNLPGGIGGRLADGTISAFIRAQWQHWELPNEIGGRRAAGIAKPAA
jgi:hypothetical protein